MYPPSVINLSKTRDCANKAPSHPKAKLPNSESAIACLNSEALAKKPCSSIDSR